MNLKNKRAAAAKAAKTALEVMQADPSEENVKAAEEAAAVLEEVDARMKRANASMEAIKSLGDSEEHEDTGGRPVQAKTVGEHFVMSAGKGLARFKSGRVSLGAPEFKEEGSGGDEGTTGSDAAGSILTQGPSGPLGAVLTEVDRTIVQGFRRPTITSLFGQARMSSQAVTYFVEGARTGDFATVAEGGALPQIDYALPTPRTDALSKIGGFIKLSDEMLEDLDYVVSEINGRLVYDLALVEESQVLSGDGDGTNLEGLLERDGVQTSTATAATLADVIFQAMGKVSNQTGLEADALVINPTDYEGLRLGKDGNDQYYGGGYFAGQYGVGGIIEQPPVWGLRTVVTPAVAAGSAVVGAFRTAATVYTKGGLWVEASNSNEDDFTNGLVTVRATKRIALAVRRPAAFVKITVGTGD